MLHQAAGYREKEEIDELIYRTVGRVPESEFLFRRNRGKRYEKKLRTGRASHINDRYMHPPGYRHTGPEAEGTGSQEILKTLRP